MDTWTGCPGLFSATCLMGGLGEILLPQGETHVLGFKGTGPD